MFEVLEGSLHDPSGQPAFERHLFDDELEVYARGLASESSMIEEHLLACPECQDRARDFEEYVRFIKRAAKELADENQDEPESSERRGLPWFRGNWNLGRLAVPAAAMAAVTIAFVFYSPDKPTLTQGEVVVSLRSLRGAQTTTAGVSAASSLLLEMDTTGLPDAALEVQIVSAQGNPVWTGSVLGHNGSARAAVRQAFRPGQYWVRLGTGGEILREFALTIR
jgi:anti-sigma factor RsiW